MKITANAQFSPRVFKIGDEVMLLDLAPQVGIKSKLRRKWVGPYIISQVTGPLSYVVTTKGGVEYRAHVEHLKPVYHLPSHLSNNNKQEPWPKSSSQPSRRPGRPRKQAEGSKAMATKRKQHETQ